MWANAVILTRGPLGNTDVIYLSPVLPILCKIAMLGPQVDESAESALVEISDLV